MPAHSQTIREWCERLGDAFGKRVTDGLIAIWQDRLAAFDEMVLLRAFTFIETNDERFPTVSRCIRMCRENVPYQSPYNYEDFRKFRKTTDAKGVACIMDVEKQERLYRAVDCEEGRTFLAKLAEVKEAVTLKPVEGFRDPGDE
jgi:hypothetical protein